MKEAKARVPKSCCIDVLKNLRVFFSPYALKLIRKQYDKYVSASPSLPLPPYTQTYEKSMGLPCAHVFERRHRNNEIIQLEDVHLH